MGPDFLKNTVQAMTAKYQCVDGTGQGLSSVVLKPVASFVEWLAFTRRNRACFGCSVRTKEPMVKLKKKCERGETFVEVPIGDYLASASRRGDQVSLTKFIK
jgi:hypothetical protein